MSIPKGFQFSQSSLQDYMDCPRRFQLRYINNLAWPAIESEPVLIMEQKMQIGARFHKMIQQHLVGVPSERITKMAEDQTLERWWQNYIDNPVLDNSANRYPEITLATSMVGSRIIAKYDLLSVIPGEKAIIIDWKTSENIPPRNRLQERIQTRVYSFLLVAAGSRFNEGQPIHPEMVEMIYWYPEHPEFPQRFSYTSKQYETDKSYLQSLIQQIKTLQPESFLQTDNLKHCSYCRYRSLCDRGINAGDITGLDEFKDEDEFDQNLDLEQIGEIAF